MEDNGKVIRPYDETGDIVKENDGRNDWDECDEDFEDQDEIDYSGLDEGFRSWEDVNGMFYRRNW